jgi:ATP-dependent DNA helicase RecG
MFKDLDIILSEGESYTIEFKESADKTLASEVCAFANASGGKLFIGVSDSGKVVGTDTSNAARSRVQDTINQIEPRLSVDIVIHENIIIVTVPEGTSKPYSCSRGFFLRSGPNSQKLERNSIVEFFQNEEHIKYDEIIRRDLLLNERFNEEAYNIYIRTAKISDVHDMETILINLDCAVEIDGKVYFTNAGALFFRINDEDVKFRHAGIVCALYKGEDKSYIIDAKELNNDIVGNIEGAITFLKRHLNISYKIETLRRENILELPEDALREAIVNAVCHRNYFERGARVMVEIYDDRVEVVSPGGVCKGITDKNFGRISITKNSIIASMLFWIDYIEQMGTGILRMKNAAKNANVAEPKFDLHDFFRVTFTRNLSTAKNETAIGSDRPAIKTSDRYSIILNYLEENTSGKNADFAKLLGLSSQRIRELLRDMIQSDLIEKHGEKRHAYYTVKK